jgi:hypothetical protein
MIRVGTGILVVFLLAGFAAYAVKPDRFRELNNALREIEGKLALMMEGLLP